MAIPAVSIDIDRILENLVNLAQAVTVGRTTTEVATQKVEDIISSLSGESRKAARLLFSRLIEQYAVSKAYTK